jgi:hypothetical protein
VKSEPCTILEKVRATNMNSFSQRTSFHQYRIAVIAAWPEGECKRAAMSAARAALIRERPFDQASRVTNRL